MTMFRRLGDQLHGLAEEVEQSELRAFRHADSRVVSPPFDPQVVAGGLKVMTGLSHLLSQGYIDESPAVARFVFGSESSVLPRRTNKGKRETPLQPEIRVAQARLGERDRYNTPLVWAMLVRMIEEEGSRLTKVTRDGIEYFGATPKSVYTRRMLQRSLAAEEKRLGLLG